MIKIVKTHRKPQRSHFHLFYNTLLDLQNSSYHTRDRLFTELRVELSLSSVKIELRLS